MLLILELPIDNDEWRLIGTADDIGEADAMTQDRRASFIVVDPDQQTVTAFQRVLQREELAPAPSRTSVAR